MGLNVHGPRMASKLKMIDSMYFFQGFYIFGTEKYKFSASYDCEADSLVIQDNYNKDLSTRGKPSPILETFDVLPLDKCKQVYDTLRERLFRGNIAVALFADFREMTNSSFVYEIWFKEGDDLAPPVLISLQF